MFKSILFKSWLSGCIFFSRLCFYFIIDSGWFANRVGLILAKGGAGSVQTGKDNVSAESFRGKMEGGGEGGEGDGNADEGE